MKILHVITGLGRGGAEQFLSRLIQHLPTKFENEVISLSGLEPVGTELIARGVAVRALGGISGPRSFLKLRKWIGDARPDVVHTWMYHADLLGGLAGKTVSRAPVVWCIRRTGLDRSYTKLGTLAVARASGVLSRVIPEKIVCCAEAAREAHIRRGYSDSKMVVIGNGVDTSIFDSNSEARTAMRATWEIGPRDPVVGMVARYHPVKNHAAFLRMARQVLENLPKAKFVLIGEGVDTSNTELNKLIASLGVGSSVRLLGHRDALWKYLPAFDLIVSASLTEGFPNVVAEAMSCGVPCVGTDVGETARIVGPTGEIVETASAEALSKACLSLLSEPSAEREQRRLRARERVKSLFSISAAVNEYAKLYEHVIAPGQQMY